jgi:hypothetical protein
MSDRKPLTAEQIAAIRHDANFQTLYLGERLAPIKARAEATLQALDEREALIAALTVAYRDLKANGDLGAASEVEDALDLVGALP